MEKGEEFYAKGLIPETETQRLQALEFPSVVSESLLDEFDIEGKKILDAGAGANTDLAKYVENRQGMYVPLDIQSVMLQKQREDLENDSIGYFGVVGSVKQLPFQSNTFDLFHQRFVLMNIDPDSREQDVREALRVSKEAVLFLEYNWNTFTSTDERDREKIDQVKDAAFELFSRFKTDPYMGTKFPELFEKVIPGVPYEVKNFLREESVDHMKELLPLISSFHQAALHRLNNEVLANKFQLLSDELTSSPISFVPPEIVAAIVKK